MYMHCIMQNFKKNAQVCVYSFADLNIGHYVEMTFFGDKLGGFLVVNTFSSEFNLLSLSLSKCIKF